MAVVVFELLKFRMQMFPLVIQMLDVLIFAEDCSIVITCNVPSKEFCDEHWFIGNARSSWNVLRKTWKVSLCVRQSFERCCC